MSEALKTTVEEAWESRESIGAETKGEVRYGRVPENSGLVPGEQPVTDGALALACAVIVKRVDERTRSKTSINELLRD
jgi:2,3,4,5-tetrahydropyridine-2-carboxylate N-succinyltransferase